jgi:glycolate oxidase
MQTTSFNKINKEIISELESILDTDILFFDDEVLNEYNHDETENLKFNPELVAKPKTVAQVSALMKFCNEKLIPVTVRGAGTGLSGGALPICGGLILSTERLNKILDIDLRNLQVTVEPGVINQVLQDEVQKHGLYYPPDPASKGSCFLGGNISHASGGPHAVKYGTTRDYVLNLEIVLPNGDIIWTGANTLKYSTGYNLTHLIIGSEGTLGVVTKIVLKLIPNPQHNVLMLIPFFDAEKACEAVSAVFRAGIIPSAMEFMERDAIDWTLKFVDGISMEIKPEIQAHLLVELDGNNLDVLLQEAEKLHEIFSEFNCDEILFADSEAQKNQLWKMRRSVAEAVKSNSVYKEEDTVVQRAELPKLLKGIKEIGSKYGFKSVCYGHAGDGNLHVNIIKGDLSDEFWQTEIHKGIEEIFALCKLLGGTISGEHGIGLVQKRYMHIVQSPIQLELQRGIKKVFDPNNILNPGKIF